MVRFAWADGWVLTLLDLLWFGPLVFFFFCEALVFESSERI